MDQKYTFPIKGVTDLNLASFLVYSGFDLVDIVLPEEQENARMQGKFGFIFRNSELIRPKIDEYFAEATMVDAKKLFNCRWFIRRQITEKQAQTRQQ